MSMVPESGAEERYEVKFAGYATEYPALLNWLRLHRAGFSTAYPDRKVNNVYFDTWDYRAYAENLAGVSNRCKVRYRWYGDSPGPDAGMLEVKLKRNRFGTKQRFRIDTAPWQPGADWAGIRARMREQLPFAGQLRLDQNPLPVMLNRYVRQYFLSADGHIRMTVDIDQCAYDQRTGAGPNFVRPAIMPDRLVLEVKFSRAYRQEAERALRDVPFRISRHSKYMNAVRAIAFTRG